MFLIALSILAGVHLIALELFLYWRYLWLDIPVHFLGGIVVVLGVYAYTELTLPFARLLSGTLLQILSIVVVVMIMWEIFEVWAGIPIYDNYVYDTALDLMMGFIGGLVGFYIAKRMKTL